MSSTRAVLRTVDGPPKILVVTTFENDEYVYEALRAGADGFPPGARDRTQAVITAYESGFVALG